MTKPKSDAATAPAFIAAHMTSDETRRNLRVVDAETGEEIASIIDADSEAGKVRRFAVDADGDLVRRDDAFQIVEEDRPIRIEWIDPPAVDAEAEA